MLVKDFAQYGCFGNHNEQTREKRRRYLRDARHLLLAGTGQAYQGPRFAGLVYRTIFLADFYEEPVEHRLCRLSY